MGVGVDESIGPVILHAQKMDLMFLVFTEHETSEVITCFLSGNPELHHCS